MITLDSSLNDVLKHLGLRKRDSANTWRWLMSKGLLP